MKDQVDFLIYGKVDLSRLFEPDSFNDMVESFPTSCGIVSLPVYVVECCISLLLLLHVYIWVVEGIFVRRYESCSCCSVP